ncbi:MAG: biotin--[acetyl-CoA-carboxylase] ligase [Nanoarchaeota archaeon]|nr:biotin--[acetyl-CoA-carboxylase] ligase [Nanoarchaeota archaeon]
MNQQTTLKKMFNIHHFKTLDSTNDKAISFKENSVIIADEQKQGKGRFQRPWISQKGGIYMSIVLPIIENPQLYTFIAALSAKQAINNKQIKIKWPNDLIYRKKKLSGILTEIKNNKTIVGIGINTNNKIQTELKYKSTSLREITKKEIYNKHIINSLLNQFESYLTPLNPDRIINDWKKSSFLGDKITVKTLSKTYEGIAFDIDKDCFLILKDKKGKKITIREGDVLC